MARVNSYDLILMDINMPVMDGYESTRRIRKFNEYVPILALTAVEVDEVRYKIYDCGMNDIVVKPYDITKFSQTVLKHLASKTVRTNRASNHRRKVI